jgi:hypothetical protein
MSRNEKIWNNNQKRIQQNENDFESRNPDVVAENENTLFSKTKALHCSSFGITVLATS